MSNKQNWVNKVVDSAGQDRIRNAIATAESKTTAEIVPMIVHSSSTHGHVSWVLFLFFSLVLWMLVPYAMELVPYGPVWFWDLMVFVCAGILTSVMSKFDGIRRLLIAKQDQRLSVDRRALLEFHNSRITATAGATGVMILVSLLEHRAVILADRAVAEKFPPETWQEIVSQLVGKIKDGDFAGGMCAAIASVGEKLEKTFPTHARDVNELGDHLVIKD